MPSNEKVATADFSTACTFLDALARFAERFARWLDDHVLSGDEALEAVGERLAKIDAARAAIADAAGMEEPVFA